MVRISTRTEVFIYLLIIFLQCFISGLRVTVTRNSLSYRTLLACRDMLLEMCAVRFFEED